MKVARMYTFELEFKELAKLPVWKGNLIRGVLGYNLRKLYCIDDSRNCHECNLLFKCPYGYLFRTTTKGLTLKKLKHYTKPYVIKPPLESKSMYNKGDKLRFSLVLFGDAMNFEDHVINAVNLMCKGGLGCSEARGQLIIRRIYVENPLKNEKEFLFEDGEFYSSNLYIKDSDLKIKVGKIFKIKFLTPFRLIRDGALVTEPSFKDLISFMLRKYSSIRLQYLGKDVDVEVEKVLKEAELVDTVSSNLQQRTFIYKNKNELFIYGDIVYVGRLSSSIRKVMGFCELTHIGKRASYGHGWYVVDS